MALSTQDGNVFLPILVVRKLRVDSNAKVLFAVYVIFQAILLLGGISASRIVLACIALKIGGYIFLLGISCLEHTRSVRPSTLLIVYLGVSIISDLLRVRALFNFPRSWIFGQVLLASFFTKNMIFVLEVTEKRSLLLDGWKDVSAEAAGSIINRALFFWLNNLFFRGFRTLLTVETLPPLDGEILTASDPTKLIERWQQANKTGRNSLLWTFMSHYQWNFLAGVLPRLACTGFAFAQPFLIQRVLDFTATSASPNTDSSAYVLIVAYAIVYIGLSLTNAVYQQKTLRLLTLFRGSLVTLIYDKTLRIDSSLIAEAEPITLMSADIDRVGSSMLIIHDLYASLIEGALSLWLLYRLLGVALVAPVIWIIVCLVATLPFANAAGRAQTPWLIAIEERLAATSRALSAMKVIKMTGLTESVSFKVASLRLSEIRASRLHRVLTTFVLVAYYVSSALAPIWGFAVYILLAKANNSETLTEGLAFASLSLFELLSQPVSTAIHGLEDIRTVINSFQRIQEYLESKEREDHRTRPNITSLRLNSSFEGLQENDDIEPPYISTGDLASSQFAITVKDASVGYSPEDNLVLKNLNFEIPRGEITMIYGSVGSGKSTTLKLLLGEVPFTLGSVSTSFSRAAYCPQSPWITGGTIRSNIVGTSAWDELWYDRVVHACALSTDFEAHASGDQTKSGPRGSRLSGGQRTRVSLARALYSRNPIMILDDVLAGLDWVTERHILNAVFGPSGLFKQLNCTVILATNSASHLGFAQNKVFLDKKDQTAYQSIPESVPIAVEAIPRLSNLPPATASQPQPELPYEILLQAEMLEDPAFKPSRHTGDMKVYAYYAKTVGWLASSVYLFACAVFVFSDFFPSVWLQWWTNANAIHPYNNIGYWLGVYIALAAVTILSITFSDCVLNLAVLPKASRKFHDLLLNTTMRAPISFFTSTETGTTLNRFSQDLDLIDNDLPMSIDQTIWSFLFAIASAALIFLSMDYVATAMPACILALVLMQFYYLKTSRQLRLLDIEAKAPLFIQFLETVEGITSIRAYGWMQNSLENSYNALNISQKPYYLLGCAQRWLALVLDLFSAGVAILVVSVVTNTRNHSTQLIGAALFNIIAFNSSLQELVTEWSHLETAIKAISRVQSYVSDVSDENLASETNKVSENWPACGAITFQDVDVSYNPSLKPALKGISLSIQAGEKLAICGRTGSGKTSFIGALLRLLEIESGTISIDAIDISTISRQEVRRRLSTLPQEPFFFQGSVRENIDPLHMASDERVIDVLRDVCMWEFYESRGGLDAKADEDKMSDGQRQLSCLARAIIKPGKILLLDEATSKVDPGTDALMQRVLRKESQGRTVIATAHKLDTVCDYDRVVLLDKGRIIEIGKPQELLATSTSAFRALYDSQS